MQNEEFCMLRIAIFKLRFARLWAMNITDFIIKKGPILISNPPFFPFYVKIS